MSNNDSGDVQISGVDDQTAPQLDSGGAGAQGSGTDAGGQAVSQGGASGMAGGLLGQAEDWLKGSSDPRAQQASDLIDKAEGLLGGQSGN